jgi:hypothetical protein
MYLAAESLKRRLTSQMDQKFDNIPLQQQFVTSIILNPTEYIPRRVTYEDKKSNISPSKFDRISPSKFDRISAQLRNSYNVDQFDPNNISFITKFLIRGSRGSTTSNKFDLSDPNILNNLETLVSRSKAFSIGGVDLQQRLSQFTTRQSQRIPLNKEYHINFERKIEHDNLCYKDGNQFLKLDSIAYTYDIKDITSVYYHMNFLKRFELPEEFENNFIEKIMRDCKKPNLERNKLKDIFRGRSNTVVLSKDKRSKFLF